MILCLHIGNLHGNFTIILSIKISWRANRKHVFPEFHYTCYINMTNSDSAKNKQDTLIILHDDGNLTHLTISENSTRKPSKCSCLQNLHTFFLVNKFTISVGFNIVLLIAVLYLIFDRGKSFGHFCFFKHWPNSSAGGKFGDMIFRLDLVYLLDKTLISGFISNVKFTSSRKLYFLSV